MDVNNKRIEKSKRIFLTVGVLNNNKGLGNLFDEHYFKSARRLIRRIFQQFLIDIIIYEINDDFNNVSRQPSV